MCVNVNVRDSFDFFIEWRLPSGEMTTLSGEQIAIVEAIAAGKSVIVNAVAGSGKTTTVLGIAQRFPDRSIVQITYNKQLKFEVRRKVHEMRLSNIEIHTYHSLAVKHYAKYAYDDIGIEKSLASRDESNGDYREIDILVVDETQDMTLLYYRLLRKYAREHAVGTIVLLGDEYQSVYDFKNADKRFLTMGDRLWPEYDFVRLSLSTSYRLTNKIAAYVNRAMLGYDRIHATRDGPRVTHVWGDVWKAHIDISKYLISGIKNKTIAPGDIFVLASSVKNPATPIFKLEHAMVDAGVPCYVPSSDQSDLDSRIINNKVVFTTFHQSKGRERDIVVVYGLDDGYFRWLGTNPTDCPSTYYVAATRARKKLIVVESRGDDIGPAPFMKMTLSDMMKTDFTNVVVRAEASSRLKSLTPSIGVSQLVRFLDSKTTFEISKIIDDIYCIECAACDPDDMIPTPSIIEEKTGPEEVADIIGVAIPAAYEKKTRGVSRVEECTIKYPAARVDGTNIESLLRMCTVYCSSIANVKFRLAQITKYNWISQEILDRCIARLEEKISKNAEYERPCSILRDDREITGVVDCIDGNVVWEFKCVSELTIEHKMQLAIYSLMIIGREYKLFNIRTGETLAIKNPARCGEILDILLARGKKIATDTSDDAFLAACDV